jgi:ATP-dependent Clp protease ATP-binding subunit ClpB
MNQNGISQEAIQLRAMEELRVVFRPEFLNRMDDVIIFQPLSREQISQIVELQLERLRRMLNARRVSLELTPAALAKLSAEGYDPFYGARPLKRVIQRRIQDPLALKLLEGEFHEGDTVLVDVDEQEEFVFQRVTNGKEHAPFKPATI